MASRDLTAAFVKQRSALVRKRFTRTSGHDYDGDSGASSYKKLTAGGGGSRNGSHDLMLDVENGDRPGGGDIQLSNLSTSRPAWVQDVDQVETILTQIQSRMTALSSMHASRVGSIFGKDLDQMERQIAVATQNITDLFRLAERHLQRVGVATRRSGNGQETTVGANVQRSLAKRLQELSLTFRQSQRKYLADVQAQKHGGSSAADAAHKFAGLDLQAESSNEFFTTQQLAVVDDLTMAVQSRDQEIAKIAQSIEELGSIFKELAVLVIDQGTILDRIDYNMEHVVESTKTGIQQLERAERSQKSARPLRCIVCLATLIFVLLLILLIKHRPRRGWF